jgi:hypothetical protein
MRLKDASGKIIKFETIEAATTKQSSVVQMRNVLDKDGNQVYTIGHPFRSTDKVRTYQVTVPEGQCWGPTTYTYPVLDPKTRTIDNQQQTEAADPHPGEREKH